MAEKFGILNHIKKNGELGNSYPLPCGRTTMGGSSFANIRLKFRHELLEPIQCIFDVKDNGLVRIINQSLNTPILVNGESVQDIKILRNADTIKVVGKVFQYQNNNIGQMDVDAMEKQLFHSPKKRRQSALVTSSKTKVKTPSRINPFTTVSLTPGMRPDTKNNEEKSKTTSKLLISKALGSPVNMRRKRLSLGDKPKTPNNISARNILLHKQVIPEDGEDNEEIPAKAVRTSRRSHTILTSRNKNVALLENESFEEKECNLKTPKDVIKKRTPKSATMRFPVTAEDEIFHKVPTPSRTIPVKTPKNTTTEYVRKSHSSKKRTPLQRSPVEKAGATPKEQRRRLFINGGRSSSDEDEQDEQSALIETSRSSSDLINFEDSFVDNNDTVGGSSSDDETVETPKNKTLDTAGGSSSDDDETVETPKNKTLAPIAEDLSDSEELIGGPSAAPDLQPKSSKKSLSVAKTPNSQSRRVSSATKRNRATLEINTETFNKSLEQMENFCTPENNTSEVTLSTSFELGLSAKKSKKMNYSSVEDDDDVTTPKSVIKSRRSKSLPYTAGDEVQDEEIVAGTLFANEKDTRVGIKTPVNTPGLFENIKKSAIKSRTKVQSSSEESLDVKGNKRRRESTNSIVRSSKRLRTAYSKSESSFGNDESLSFDSFASDDVDLVFSENSMNEEIKLAECIKNLTEKPVINLPRTNKSLTGPKLNRRNVTRRSLEAIKLGNWPRNTVETDVGETIASTSSSDVSVSHVHQQQSSSVDDFSDVDVVKKLTPTAKVQKSPKNDLRDVRGLKRLLGTPKVVKSPKNDLTNVGGVKKLLQTPKVMKTPKNDLTNVPNLRNLMSPKVRKSPKNDLSNIVGVKKLLGTPKHQKSPKNDLTKVPNLRNLVSPKLQKSPLNDLSQVHGIKHLLRSPKEPNNDLRDVEGVDCLFNISGVNVLPNDANEDTEDNMFDKLFEKKTIRTYRGKSMSPIKSVRRNSYRKSLGDLPIANPQDLQKWLKEQEALSVNDKNLEVRVEKVDELTSKVKRGRRKQTVNLTPKMSTRGRRNLPVMEEIVVDASVEEVVPVKKPGRGRKKVLEEVEVLKEDTPKKTATRGRSRKAIEKKEEEIEVAVPAKPVRRTRKVISVERDDVTDISLLRDTSVTEPSVDVAVKKTVRRPRKVVTFESPAVEVSLRKTTRNAKKIVEEVEVVESPAKPKRNTRARGKKEEQQEEPVKSKAEEDDLVVEASDESIQGKSKRTKKVKEVEEVESPAKPKRNPRGRRKKQEVQEEVLISTTSNSTEEDNVAEEAVSKSDQVNTRSLRSQTGKKVKKYSSDEWMLEPVRKSKRNCK